MDYLEKYWTKRYAQGNTGWDLGSTSAPLKEYLDQLENKELKILIPGAGNGYEAEYLFKNGFKNVYVLDISRHPLLEFENRNPIFPKENILNEDFFSHIGQYDLILEQTFFCSFIPLPSTRQDYARKMHENLKPGGKLVGLWFDTPLVQDTDKRPFGGSLVEYRSYLDPYFDCKYFGPCYNSILPRAGKELFGIFIKK